MASAPSQRVWEFCQMSFCRKVMGTGEHDHAEQGYGNEQKLRENRPELSRRCQRRRGCIPGARTRKRGQQRILVGHDLGRWESVCHRNEET